MLALIIVVCITAITTLGSNANNTFSYVAGQVGKTGGS
jgi:pilus assembly protein Flp/PilA